MKKFILCSFLLSVFLGCKKEEVKTNNNNTITQPNDPNGNGNGGTGGNGGVADLTESTFTDARDGKTYDIISANGLWWMVDNFDYDYTGSNHTVELWDGTYILNSGGVKKWNSYYDNKSFPHSPNDQNGNIYGGRLYTYQAALNAAPPGWRLANFNEYLDASNNVNGFNAKIFERTLNYTCIHNLDHSNGGLEPTYFPTQKIGWTPDSFDNGNPTYDGSDGRIWKRTYGGTKDITVGLCTRYVKEI